MKRRKQQRIDTSLLLTKAIQTILDNLKLQRHRSSTRKNYYSVWKLFNEFFIHLDVKPDNWEDHIILFSGYLIDNDRKLSTVKSYISAIKTVLKADDVEINENRYLINSLTRVCSFQNDRICMRLPIRKNLLFLLMDKIPDVFRGAQPYLITLYRAVFIAAYLGLFRVSEITESQHVLRAVDVKIADNKKKIKFILQTLKTHWKNTKPQVIKIMSDNNSGVNRRRQARTKKKMHVKIYCPFKQLQNYINIRGRIKNDNEQCFIFQDGSPVTPNHYRSVLKKTIKLCGLHPTNYGCHSTRAGRAIDLVEVMKLDVPRVKVLGCWKSNIIYQYLKDV